MNNVQTRNLCRAYRNAMREVLWANDHSAHMFLCHSDGSPCLDGCDQSADPVLIEFYQSELESEPMD